MSGIAAEISLLIGMREHEVHRIMSTAPSRYKVFYIMKRNGGRREIAQPALEVKLLQRALMKLLLEKLPVHPAATAYISGTSILKNAEPHASNGPILKLDFKDFFPSIKAADWASYCRATGCLVDEGDIFLTSRLLFRRPKGQSALRLAIGAPSSPMLSNILMREFDQIVTDEVTQKQIVYTRYADDMTFSAPRLGYLSDVVKVVARIIRSLNAPNLDLNREKTHLVTKKFHRTITGLTLSNDGRVTIGRDKKRLIRASVHAATTGKLSEIELEMLAGMLAYVNSVEPAYIEVLSARYGQEAISKVLRTPKGKKIDLHKPPLALSDLGGVELPPLRRRQWRK